MIKQLSALWAFALVLGCGSQQKNTDQTKTITDENLNTTYAETITAEELKTDLYTYASDDFEGREAGQPGQKKAVEFLKNRYEELGIASPIAPGDYFQEVPLEVMEAPGLDLSINRKAFKAVDDLVSVSAGATGTISASEVVYAGYGIEDEGFSNYNDLDVKDKVVLVKAGEPQNEDGTYVITGTEEASKWSNFRQEFASKQDVAKEHSAKALLFYHPSAYQMVAMRFGSASGRMSLKDNSSEMYFLFVNNTVAESLVADIETNDTPKTVTADFKLDYTNNSTELTSENVLAYIKGSEKPEETVVISAHLDHEGIKNGKVYNGADDDGSGTVAILEMAEAFQQAVKDGNGPKRSILFLHVTAEEKGLLGSRYYTDVDPVIPLENTVTDLNIDMIGRTDPKRTEGDRNYVYLIGSDKLSTELHELSEEVNEKYAHIELDYTYNDENDPNRFYYRSDHYNFAKNNIPIIFYFNGTHDDYHQPSDTPDKIEYDLLENRTRLVFYTAWEVANRDKRLVVDKAEE